MEREVFYLRGADCCSSWNRMTTWQRKSCPSTSVLAPDPEYSLWVWACHYPPASALCWVEGSAWSLIPLLLSDSTMVAESEIVIGGGGSGFVISWMAASPTTLMAFCSADTGLTASPAPTAGILLLMF